VAPPVLFDLAPKRCKRDFYNFEHELEQLHKFYLNGRVVAILGLRRIGKTSLILTFLNEWRVPNVFIDRRKVLLPVMALALGGLPKSFQGL
jgi:AAA+ ATPase superfamily predicted ATPase